jgi:hypothetical protein
MPATTVPRTHQELTEFAKEILDNLIEKYQSDGQRFIDDSKPSTGIIYTCAGTVALLLLANNFEELDEKNRTQEIVIREFDRVYSYISEKGYDATPLVTEGLTKSLFSTQADPRYYYMDSVSWVLGLALHVRMAVRTKRFNVEKEFLDRVFELAKSTLTIICDSTCPQGGWNFSNGCTAPHLYYSYAVAEALADFGDYVLGETPEIFGEQSNEQAEDKELIKFLGETLISRVEDSRKRTGEWLKDNFLADLGSNEINPSPDSKQKQQVNHLLLYYTYFVIDMLIICKADEFFEDWGDRINMGIEHGIYLSRIDFDRAYVDKEWFDNPDESSLRLHWDNHENPSILPKRDVKLEEPGLVPLSVRCNALYAYYIADGEDKKMYDLFTILFNNRNPATGLWDSASYNLMVTERAIEAIVDYHDYLLKFETPVSLGRRVNGQESTVEASFRTLVADAVKDYLKSPDGGATLKAGASPSAISSAATTMDENQLLYMLTSALAIGEQYLNNGNEDPTLLKSETFNRFRSRFSDFLITLFYERLRATVKDTTKHEKLRLATSHNGKRLFDQLGPWLSENPRVDLGAVFNYLIHEAVKDLDQQVIDLGKNKPGGGRQ